MTMADPTRVEEILESEWGSDRETTRKTMQEIGEDAIDAMFEGGTVAKNLRTDESEVVGTMGNVAFTKDDVAAMRDRNKSTEELLREIRDELRGGNGVRTDGGPKRNGNRESVSKSEVVLKESDVDALMAAFTEDTGVSLADPNGVASFREWLESRVYTDGPGGGPHEEKLLEEIEEQFEELQAGVREAVEAATDGKSTEKSGGRDTVRKSVDGRGSPRTDGGSDRDKHGSIEDLSEDKRREYRRAIEKSKPYYDQSRESLEKLTKALDDGLSEKVPV